MNVSRMLRGIVASGMVLLAACSGGGVDGPSSTPSPSATLSTTTVSVDLTVPASVASAITEVISPTSSGTTSGSIQIATIPGSDSMLLAMDANGKLRLAAMASGPITTLNAESTAVALVRIAIGTLPSGISASQANQTIRAAAEFASLVLLIENALKTDQPPLNYVGVAESVVATMGQTMGGFSRLLTAVPSASSALAFVSPPVVTPLPFNIVSGLGSLASIYVDSAGSGGSINLVNAMPIAWSASTKDESGVLIPAPSPSLDGKVLLTPNGLMAALLNKVNPWVG